MVFGRKKKEIDKELEKKVLEMERQKEINEIKEAVIKESKQPVEQLPADPKPVIREKETNVIYIGRKIVEDVQEERTIGDGQVIRTGKVLTRERFDIMETLSIEDIIDVIAFCKGSKIGEKMRKILRDMLV